MVGLLKPWWNLSSVYPDQTFAYNRSSSFTLSSLNMREQISSRFKKLKFQPGLKISLQLAHEMQLFTKIVNHFRKRLHLRSLTVFWTRLCCVRDNHLSVNFPTKLYLLLFLVCSGDSKLCLFSSFPIFHETHHELKHLHYNWQQNPIGKVSYIFQSVST